MANSAHHQSSQTCLNLPRWLRQFNERKMATMRISLSRSSHHEMICLPWNADFTLFFNMFYWIFINPFLDIWHHYSLRYELQTSTWGNGEFVQQHLWKHDGSGFIPWGHEGLYRNQSAREMSKPCVKWGSCTVLRHTARLEFLDWSETNLHWFVWICFHSGFRATFFSIFCLSLIPKLMLWNDFDEHFVYAFPASRYLIHCGGTHRSFFSLSSFGTSWSKGFSWHWGHMLRSQVSNKLNNSANIFGVCPGWIMWKIIHCDDLPPSYSAHCLHAKPEGVAVQWRSWRNGSTSTTMAENLDFKLEVVSVPLLAFGVIIFFLVWLRFSSIPVWACHFVAQEYLYYGLSGYYKAWPRMTNSTTRILERDVDGTSLNKSLWNLITTRIV